MTRVLLFGSLGERLGRELALELDGPSTVAGVRRELARLHPACAGDLAAARARALVNDEMAAEDRAVGTADEIAFLPPLSGG